MRVEVSAVFALLVACAAHARMADLDAVLLTHLHAGEAGNAARTRSVYLWPRQR